MAQVPDFTTWPPKLVRAVTADNFYFCEQVIEPVEPDNYTYLIRQTKKGVWYFTRITETGVFTQATIKNNAGVTTYDDALQQYATLTYGSYLEAF